MEKGRATFFDDRHPGCRRHRGDRREWAGGHPPGQSAVMVRTVEGPVLLASDAVHYYDEECDRNMPFMSVASLIGMRAGSGMIKVSVIGKHGS